MIPTIYLAGKISRGDWRHELVDGRLRGEWKRGYEPGHTNTFHTSDWPTDATILNGAFRYAGPFFISDDHGCGHGSGSHGCGHPETSCFEAPSRHSVVKRCEEAIEQSDIVFAWLDDVTAYGTLYEIGRAKALKKRVVLSWPKRFNDTVGRDFWFIIESVKCIMPAETPGAALAELALDYQYIDQVPMHQDPVFSPKAFRVGRES